MTTREATRRLVKSRSGLRVVSLEGSSSSPFELSEPFWTPDSETNACVKCQTKFDFLTRRHHCRRCGHIFCKNCCDVKLPLPRMCFIDPVRVCDGCVEVTRKENEFYDKHLKILLSGANFFLSHSSGADSDITFLCCLSSDQKAIIFDGGSSWKHDPVQLVHISSLKIIGTTGSPGLSQVTGALLTHLDSSNQEQELHLSISNVPNRKQSTAWISALQKALKFISPVAESP